jgi:hypothetical protein
MLRLGAMLLLPGLAGCSTAPSEPESDAAPIVPCGTASARLCVEPGAVPDGMAWCALACYRPCDPEGGELICSGDPECSPDETARPEGCP